jgi:F0F1-type ATP synthase membrane subunit c/vacuolar-type H+-ATPase subunit K
MAIITSTAIKNTTTTRKIRKRKEGRLRVSNFLFLFLPSTLCTYALLVTFYSL